MVIQPLNTEVPIKDKMHTGEVLKVSLMKEIIKPTSPHRHANYHEFIFLSQGSGFHEMDQQEYDVISPVAYYLRPGQTHCWNFSSIPKGYVILFREELLLKEDIDLLYTFPAHIQLKDQAVIFTLLDALYLEFKIQNSGTEVHQAYLHLLIAKLKMLSQSPAAHHGATQLFQQYKRLINDHFLQQRQLNFYAGALNITPAVLNSTCKKAVDKTALAVINERILLEAKILLSATGKAISEIAHDLGFADSPHFIKFFKLYTNLTPGNYRELALNKR